MALPRGFDHFLLISVEIGGFHALTFTFNYLFMRIFRLHSQIQPDLIQNIWSNKIAKYSALQNLSQLWFRVWETGKLIPGPGSTRAQDSSLRSAAVAANRSNICYHQHSPRRHCCFSGISLDRVLRPALMRAGLFI